MSFPGEGRNVDLYIMERLKWFYYRLDAYFHSHLKEDSIPYNRE
jgi:hypothetical protein